MLNSMDEQEKEDKYSTVLRQGRHWAFEFANKLKRPKLGRHSMK